MPSALPPFTASESQSTSQDGVSHCAVVPPCGVGIASPQRTGSPSQNGNEMLGNGHGHGEGKGVHMPGHVPYLKSDFTMHSVCQSAPASCVCPLCCSAGGRVGKLCGKIRHRCSLRVWMPGRKHYLSRPKAGPKNLPPRPQAGRKFGITGASNGFQFWFPGSNRASIYRILYPRWSRKIF
jgi:hypothetical protein